jgi:hypothetical protein
MIGQGAHISLFKHILEFLVLGRNFMWTWPSFGEGRTQIKNAFPFVTTFMKAFALTNNGLGHLGHLVPSRFSFYFKFSMLLTKVSHSKALCYGVSK